MVREVSPTEALARQQGGATLIDLRDAAEREIHGAPPGAVAIPLADIETGAAGMPGQHADLVLLCARGRRSQRAGAVLAERGYSRLASVAGGFARWQQEGLACEPRAIDPETAERYARQLGLPEVGIEGQRRLAASRVVLVGAGGLGCPAAQYLAGAGVGSLRLIDDDLVERSNLQRQVLHTDARVGESKVDSARQALLALNPSIRIETRHCRLDGSNADDLLKGHDVLIDGADNFPTRYLLSAASLRLAIPMVYGAVERFRGQVSVFDPRRDDSPCYRCLFPTPPAAGEAPNCTEAGVLGVLPGMVGMLQATETLKLLLGIGDTLIGRLLRIDALAMRFAESRLPRDPDCPGCAADR